MTLPLTESYRKKTSRYDLCPRCLSSKREKSKLCHTCWRNDRRPVEQPEDPSIRHIPLSQGQVAIVDAADYEWLNQWKWNARFAKNTQSFYALRHMSVTEDQLRPSVYMHRQILGLEKNDPLFGDHINGNTLDYRRANLRIATQHQNRRNSHVRRDSKTALLGVYKMRDCNRYHARISINGRRTLIGPFVTVEAAHEAYIAALKSLHGEDVISPEQKIAKSSATLEAHFAGRRA